MIILAITLPLDHKLVNLFGILVGAEDKSTWKIKLFVPVDDGGIDCTPKVANVFDNIVINNKLYIFSIEQLCSTYQNHNACTFWIRAMKETQDFKNDNGTYKPDTFQKLKHFF